MVVHASKPIPLHRILAVLCLGLFAGAMALNAVPRTQPDVQQHGSLFWDAFQYGLPFLMAGLCLTNNRWALMTVVIYGTIGLALDLATFVQSLTHEQDSVEFIVVICTTALLNFMLIALGGRAVLTSHEATRCK